MDNLYEDESMMEPIEPIAAVASEEKKVKKQKPVGQSRKGDYNDARAKEAGIVPDETGHSGSVAEANKQEKKRYQLPQGSYYSLKGPNHETLQKSIDAEADPKVEGGPRRPVQSTVDGEIFFIPKSAPTPHGMVDFSLKTPSRSEEALAKANPKSPITPLAEDIVPIKKDMVLTDLQAKNLERLRKTTDDFYLPENMKAAILGQMKSESSYNKDAVGDRGRAFGYLQLRGPRLKFFLENYYGDNEGISNILRNKPKLTNLNKNEQAIIAEAFRNDADNEKKTFKYFIGELNPNNQDMPKYYDTVNVPTDISGMNPRRQAQFNRLYNNKDTSVDDWNRFFTLEYTRSGAALSKKKGVSEEQIKNRLGESKTISKNVSRRSFIKNMSGRFFDGLKRAGIYSEENK